MSVVAQLSKKNASKIAINHNLAQSRKNGVEKKNDHNKTPVTDTAQTK